MFQVSTTSFHAPRSLFRKLNMALFNRTARLHTRQCWLKTELLPTAVNSLLKMYGLRPRVTSALWGLCLNITSHFNSSRRTPMSSRKFCSWYGTSDQLPQSHIELSEKTSGCVQAGGGWLFRAELNIWHRMIPFDYSDQIPRGGSRVSRESAMPKPTAVRPQRSKVLFEILTCAHSAWHRRN